MSTEDNQWHLKKQRILLLDNYDSFTYNILHYVEVSDDVVCDVIRNDQFDLSELEQYHSFILSPGPGLPYEAGNLIPLIKAAYQHKKLLGICLGHQALAIALGGELKQLTNVMHGLQRTCTIIDEQDPLFYNLPKSFEAGRYHSWVVEGKNLPNNLVVSSIDENNNIMSMHHTELSVFGVQFHPESVMTPLGKQILSNWINLPF